VGSIRHSETRKGDIFAITTAPLLKRSRELTDEANWAGPPEPRLDSCAVVRIPLQYATLRGFYARQASSLPSLPDALLRHVQRGAIPLLAEGLLRLNVAGATASTSFALTLSSLPSPWSDGSL
jgi:hypothetical protein